MEPGVDRPDGDAERLCDDVRREVQAEPKHEDRPVLEAQAKEGPLRFVPVEDCTEIVSAPVLVEGLRGEPDPRLR